MIIFKAILHYNNFYINKNCVLRNNNRSENNFDFFVSSPDAFNDGRSMVEKRHKVDFFTIFATPKIVPSMQLRGLNQINLYFVKFLIFRIYLAQLMRNRQSFFSYFFHPEPPGD